jgi:rRNA-processing protein FCF1
MIYYCVVKELITLSRRERQRERERERGGPILTNLYKDNLTYFM